MPLLGVVAPVQGKMRAEVLGHHLVAESTALRTWATEDVALRHLLRDVKGPPTVAPDKTQRIEHGDPHIVHRVTDTEGTSQRPGSAFPCECTASA